jgi:Ca-activated chloride channel family protein
VGYDVNTHFLDRLGQDNHGTSDYVRPSEDIEVKVSNFYKKISHPILTDITLSFGDIEVSDLYPRKFPDIFKGSQLLVLGKFRKGGQTEILLSGYAMGTTRKFKYDVNFTSYKRNEFIPRLWATRRIGYLIDQMRLHGQKEELVDEVVRLSKKYGIITEYTSFLVDADYRMSRDQLLPLARSRIAESEEITVGKKAVDQALNLKYFSSANRAPRGTLDTEGKEQRISNVVQVGSRTFFNKNGLWVDTEYEGKTESIKIKIFSEAYFKILDEAPHVGRFLALGDGVIFFMHGKAIHISDEGKSDFSPSEVNSLFPG